MKKKFIALFLLFLLFDVTQIHTKEPTSEQTQSLLPSHKNYINTLYSGISGFGIPREDEQHIRDKGGAPTYGEITYEGAKELLDDLNLTKNDIFYDLGSGVGKMVVQTAIITPVKKAIGVELSTQRHGHAMKVVKRVRKSIALKPYQELEFINGDITDILLDDATVIYMSSLCFPQELMKKLTEKLSRLKAGLRVITLKQLSGPNKFKLIKQYKIPMSWSTNVPVYLYELRP